MADITHEEMIEIKRKVKEEFPGDPALQQVHIARKMLAKEAELSGLSFVDYIKSLRAAGRKDPGEAHL